MCEVNHPSIVPFIGVSFDIDGLENDPCLVFEWMQNGNLEEYLAKNEVNSDALGKMVMNTANPVS